MNKLKIKDSFEIDIDSVQDGVEFKMLLFNEGNYDRNKLRTIIRNTGLRLNITNYLYYPINISNLYFGLFTERKLKKLYSSSQLVESLPTSLYSGGNASFYFYGWQIKEILLTFDNEEGAFIFSTGAEDKYFNSSRFNGNNIEKKLTLLEDGEMVNWGNKKYNSLDIEVNT